MDIEMWVMPAPDNAESVLRALHRFGAPLNNATRDDFKKYGTVFQIGVAPRRIDIITAASGLQFEEAFQQLKPVTQEASNKCIDTYFC